MSAPDPVRYPLPSGSPAALRQDIQRTRTELGQTLEVLAGRLDPMTQLRARAPGLVVAGLAGLLGGLLLRRHRLVGVTAGVLVAIAARAVPRRRPARPPRPAVEPPDRKPADVLDVVDILRDQHRQIEEAFAWVRADSADRLERFAALVEMLNRHESAEREIVHPALAATGPAGAAVVADRRAEEQAADRTVAHLIFLGVGHRDFDGEFDHLERDVRAHVRQEETVEFPLLRQAVPVAERRRLANRVNAALAGTG